MNKILITTALILSSFGLNAKTQRTDSLIYKTLLSHGYSHRHATFWIKVSKLETANYTSVLYRLHNNMWGMSYFKYGKRPTKGSYKVYHKGKPTRFAGYKTREAAVEELILYLKTAKYPKDFKCLEEFVCFMKDKGYFEEPIDYYYKIISQL